MNSSLLVEMNPNLERRNELMKTIKPMDFKRLQNKILPKPNYDQL